ncbi:MAG: retropepsin-like aspartic protease [Candidatus Omnitrophota bacterium]
MKKFIPILSLVLLCFYIVTAKADILYLENGRKIEGLIKSENEQSVELDIGEGTIRLQKSEIADIQRSDVNQSARIRQQWREEKKAVKKIKPQEKKEEQVKPKDVGFSHSDKGMVVDVVLNNSVQAFLILDTGSSLVVLSKNVSDRLGLDLRRIRPEGELILADGKKARAKYLVLKTVTTHGVEAKNVEAAILIDDSPDINFGDGLLGMSFLKRFNFKVDQKNKRLILEKIP